MPKVTTLPDGSSLTEFSVEEIQRTFEIMEAVSQRLGYDYEEQENDHRPSIHSISYVVGWAFAYAPEDKPLNESHPQWREFFQESEWFRAQIIDRLSLPADTTWETIYRIAGCLIDEEYAGEEAYYEAYYFGKMTRLTHPEAARRLDKLEGIKFLIVGRC